MSNIFDTDFDAGDSGNIFDGPARPKKQAEAQKPKEEPSYASRVWHEGLPAVANTMMSIPKAIGAGTVAAPYTAYQMAKEGSVSKGLEKGGQFFEHMMDPTMSNGQKAQFGGPRAEEATQHAGELMSLPFEYAGRGAENVAMAIRPDQGGYPGLRTTMEAGSQLLPIPGVEGAATGLYRGRRAIQGRMAGSKEYGSWGQGMMPEGPPKPTEMRGPDQSGAQQPYLFADEQTGVPSDVRSPYNLPQSEVDRISEEIRRNTEGGDQGDLFTGYNPVDKFRLDEGGVGARDKAEGPDLEGMRGQTNPQYDATGQLTGWDKPQKDNFQPKLTTPDYTGPTTTGEPAGNLVHYDPTDPNFKGWKDAILKPGFLRDAVDQINLRFDKVREQEASHGEGQAKLDLEARASARNRDLVEPFRAEDVAEALNPLPIPPQVQRAAETRVMRHKKGQYVQYLPTDQVWSYRDHNRLTDPKSVSQFESKEASVLKNGLFEHLELKYSTVDGKVVLTNGNTRASLAMKHGLHEVPVHVTVINKPLPKEEAPNGVNIGQKNLPKGDARPEDIGLKGRDPVPDPLLKPKDLGQTRKGRSQRGGPGIWSPKTPADIKETIQRLRDEDNRPLKEVVKPYTTESVKDLDSPTHNNFMKDIRANLKQASRLILDARSVRTLLGEAAGDIAGWVGKRMENTDRWFRNTLADFVEGSKFGTGIRSKWDFMGAMDKVAGRNFIRRLPEGGIHDLFNRFSALPDAKDLAKTIDEWNGKDGTPTFKNPAHEKIWTELQSMLSKLHNIANEARKLNKIDAAAWVPNFFPRVRMPGDYIMLAHDPKTRELAWAGTFRTPGLATKAKAMLEAHPDTKHLMFQDPVHKKIVGKAGADFQALVETRRAMADNPEIVNAIDGVIQDLVGRRGAGGHFMERAQRKIGGYLGDDGNISDLKQAMLNYTEHVLNYSANLKRRAIQNELNDLRFDSPNDPKQVMRTNSRTGGVFPDKGNKLEDIAPNLHSYLSEYIMAGRGAVQALDQLDKAFMEEFGKGLQIGASGIQRSFYKLNNFATVGFLLKNPFWLSQFAQPAQAFARIMKLRQDLGERNPVMTVGMAALHMLKGISHTLAPRFDEHASPMVAHMVKQGYVDPMTQHMFEATDNYGPISGTFYQFTGNLERDAVRIPTGLILESAIRDLIPDAKTRYDIATSAMFRTTAATTKSNLPLLYTRMGPWGILAKNLKSYGTNAYGQFAEYIQHAMQGVEKGELEKLAPLGAYVGTSALIGGIMGVITMQEADALITLYNAGTNSNVRTPQEWIMTGGMSDLISAFGAPKLAQDLDGFVKKNPGLVKTATFGLASYALGHNIQAQVANPPATSLIDIVPAKLIWSPSGGGLIGESLRNYVTALAQGQLTDAIRMKAYEAITLNNPHARALIEKHFQKPGQPVPQPGQNMGGNYWRDDAAYRDRIMMGAKTLDEAQADLLYGMFKRHESRLERNRANDRTSFVDDLLNGDMSSEKIMRYSMQGGDIHSLKQDIQNTILQRNMSGMDYQTIKGGRSGGPGYAKKMEEMSPYSNANPQNIFDQQPSSQSVKDEGPRIQKQSGLDNHTQLRDTMNDTANQEQNDRTRTEHDLFMMNHLIKSYPEREKEIRDYYRQKQREVLDEELNQDINFWKKQRQKKLKNNTI